MTETVTAPAAAHKRRSKGEQTRNSILEAALRVIAELGLRSVTHRAVAAEAGVQLSLTTYYFKDIDELIEQAFTLFCERSRPGYEQVWAAVFAYLDDFPSGELRKTPVRERICQDLSSMATDYLIAQVVEKPLGLAVEQEFFTTVRLTSTLRSLAAEHRRHLLEPLVEMCRRFNKSDPEIDAELLLDTMTRLEYEALLLDREQIDREGIERMLRRQIGWALGLKRA